MRRSIILITALILISPVIFIAVDGDESESNSAQIAIPMDIPRRYDQYGEIVIHPEVSNIDPDDTYVFRMNMENELDGVESVIDQLSPMDLSEGVDWYFNMITGDFWWKINDQDIWYDGELSYESIEVTLVFGIENTSGMLDCDSATIILDDFNEPPDAPEQIHAMADDTEIDTELPVYSSIRFWVDNVSDPDRDAITYNWDFGDGTTSQGRVVYHTYGTTGFKTVQMWVDDGQDESDKIALRIYVNDPIEPTSDDDDGPATPYSSSSSSTFPILIVIVGTIFFSFMIIMMIVAVIIIRMISEGDK